MATEESETIESVVLRVIKEGVRQASATLRDTSHSLIPHKNLTREEICEGLSRLGASADGSAFVFLNLDVPGAGLTNIELLKSYVHLQAINLSKNHIKDVSCLGSLLNLLSLNVAHNNLASLLDISPSLEYLQTADFSHNHIAEIPDLTSFTHLRTLNLKGNHISDIGSGISKCTSLQSLNLADNTIDIIAGIDGLRLHSLDLSNNGVRKIDNMENLKYLTHLNLSGNKIRSLKGLQALSVLDTLDVSHNNIIDVVEVRFVRDLPLIRVLNLAANPLDTLPDYRLSMIFRIQRLSVLDGDTITPEEKVAAINLCDPSPYVIASIDHAMHLTRQLDRPCKVLESTTASLEVPYPLLVLVGSAGCGKRELRNRLVNDYPALFAKCLSHTTRTPRSDEQDGQDYHFISQSEMEQSIEDAAFFQTCRLFGQMYGLSVEAIEDIARAKKIGVLVMEFEGAETLKQTYLRPCFVYVRSALHTSRTEQYENLVERGNYFDYVVDDGELDDKFSQVTVGPMSLLTQLKDRAWSSHNNLYI